MHNRKKKGRDIHGLLVLDKPAEASSNIVLQKVKRIFDARKAGHTGTLDPIATGVLVVCFGRATKVSQHLLDARKTYRVVCRLGEETETGDREGAIIETHSVEQRHHDQIASVLQTFTGQIEQVPPMYSAIKYQGTPLYRLARKGQTVERAARSITIYSITQVGLQNNNLTIDVSCSKGTYVRTLVEEIGRKLGCGAYVRELCRLQVGGFTLEEAYSFEKLEALRENGLQDLDRLLHPIEDALRMYPELSLPNGLIEVAIKGKRLKLNSLPESEYLRIYDRNGIFYGLGEIHDNGRMALRTFAG